jgi:transcriptional regulator with XRE-family HTH domain
MTCRPTVDYSVRIAPAIISLSRTGRDVVDLAIGRQLRAQRTAAGRTVASVAADAGLSVPYIANLENGRGNPTTAALQRLAEALGMRLVVALVPDHEGQASASAAAAEVPASLVRLGRTSRFRHVVAAMAENLGRDTAELSPQLVAVLAMLADTIGMDLAEPDWWRLLDALLLIAGFPATA